MSTKREEQIAKLAKAEKKIEELQDVYKEYSRKIEELKLASKKIDHWFATIENSGIFGEVDNYSIDHVDQPSIDFIDFRD